MEPTVKKQKVQNQTPLILLLPSDAFFHIYSFADPSDLFFAIPFVCKTIYQQLKKLSVSEEKLQLLLEEFSKAEQESAAKRKQHQQKLKQKQKEKQRQWQRQKQQKKLYEEEEEDQEEEKEEKKQAVTKDDDEEKEGEEEKEEEEEEEEEAASNNNDNDDEKAKSDKEDADDPKPMTTADFFSKHSATEENLVWKQKCIVTMPSLKMIQHNHLYCYRRLFMKKNNLPFPIYYHEKDVHSIIAKMKAIKDTTVKKMLEVVKQDAVALYQQKQAEKEAREETNAKKSEEELHKAEGKKTMEGEAEHEEEATVVSKEGITKKSMVESEEWKKAIAYHESLFAEQAESLVDEIKELSAKAKELSSFRSRRANRNRNGSRVYDPHPDVKEHEDIIRFLQDTVIITSETTTDPEEVPYRGDCNWMYECTVELVSPINGAIVRFTLEYSIDGTSEDHNLSDISDISYALSVQYCDALGRQVFHEKWKALYRSSLLIELDRFWLVVRHLELDTFCGEDVVLKMKLAHRLWHDVVQSTLLENAGDDFNSCQENTSVDIPTPPDSPCTPFENYCAQFSLPDSSHKNQWELLTAEEKKRFEEKSKKQEAKYKAKFPEFKQRCQEAFQHL